MGCMNYDVFITKPGQLDEMSCSVCGTKCLVERNVMGPTGWASAVGGIETLHDRFTCSHKDENWHETALKLVKAIEETPSKRLAELMRLDLQDILKEQKE